MREEKSAEEEKKKARKLDARKKQKKSSKRKAQERVTNDAATSSDGVMEQDMGHSLLSGKFVLHNSCSVVYSPRGAATSNIDRGNWGPHYPSIENMFLYVQSYFKNE